MGCTGPHGPQRTQREQQHHQTGMSRTAPALGEERRKHVHTPCYLRFAPGRNGLAVFRPVTPQQTTGCTLANAFIWRSVGGLEQDWPANGSPATQGKATKCIRLRRALPGDGSHLDGDGTLHPTACHIHKDHDARRLHRPIMMIGFNFPQVPRNDALPVLPAIPSHALRSPLGTTFRRSGRPCTGGMGWSA